MGGTRLRVHVYFRVLGEGVSTAPPPHPLMSLSPQPPVQPTPPPETREYGPPDPIFIIYLLSLLSSSDASSTGRASRTYPHHVRFFSHTMNSLPNHHRLLNKTPAAISATHTSLLVYLWYTYIPLALPIVRWG